MDNEDENQNAEMDKVHEDLLNTAINQFRTEKGINIGDGRGILVLAVEGEGDIALPFIIPTEKMIDEIIYNFSLFTRTDPTVAPEVMVGGVLSFLLNGFRAAHDKDDKDEWTNLTIRTLSLLLGLHIKLVDREKVTKGLSDSLRDKTVPVLYGHAENGMLTTGLIYINRESSETSLLGFGPSSRHLSILLSIVISTG